MATAKKRAPVPVKTASKRKPASKPASEKPVETQPTPTETEAQAQEQAQPVVVHNAIGLGPGTNIIFPYQFSLGFEHNGDLNVVTTIMSRVEYKHVKAVIDRALAETPMFLSLGLGEAEALLAQRSALQVAESPEAVRAYIENISKLPVFSLSLDFININQGLPPVNAGVYILYKGKVWNGRLYSTDPNVQPTEFAIETPDEQACFVKIENVTAWSLIP